MAPTQQPPGPESPPVSATSPTDVPEHDSDGFADDSTFASEDDTPSAPGDLDPTIKDHERYSLGPAFAFGGIGVVRRGTDRRLGRVIAIKELQHDTPTARRRFVLEAAVTARLQHPNIIPLYDLRWDPAGKPYYCMKLVDGESLEAKIAQARDLEQRLRLLEHVLAVADAIAYAHEQRVLHRDLKPANVLIGRFGETVVIDWGLAKELSRRLAAPPLVRVDEAAPVPAADMTAAGTIMGTPCYMSPEQAAGRPLGERSDVYALGATLFQVLTGRPPFAGLRGPALLAAVIRGQFAAVQSLAPEVPRELAAIAHRAMAREPGDRYGSAAEVAEDLRRFQAGRLVSAHTYSLADMVRIWVRRHWVPLSVSAFALAGLVLTVIVAFVQVTRERDTAEEAREEARHNLDLANRAETERGEHLYRSLLLQARASQRALDPGRRFASLEAIAAATALARQRGLLAERRPALRDAAIASLGLVDARRLRRWQPGTVGRPGFDGRLERVAVPLPDDAFSVRTVEDDREVLRFPNPGHDAWWTAAQFLRDDTHVNLHYADRDGRSYWHVVDVRGAAPVERLHLRDTPIAESGDGRTAWRLDEDGHLLAVRIDDGQVVRRLATRLDPRETHHLFAHPDGRWLAAAHRTHKQIDIVDLEADAIASTLPHEGDAWSWGQVDMFAVSARDRIDLWDPTTGALRGALRDYDDSVVGLEFHPGRRLLGSCSWDGRSRFWEATSLREVLRLDGCFLRFAADGRRFAMQQQWDLELWEFVDSDVLRAAPGWARALDFSPDGRLLLLAGNLGVELWDPAGVGRRVWRFAGGSCWGATFLPDGAGFLTICDESGMRAWALTADAPAVGPPRFVFQAPPGRRTPVAFPADEPSLFAAIDGDDVRLFDAATLTEVGHLRGWHSLTTLAISPDGRWVAAAGWKTSAMHVWDRSRPGGHALLLKTQASDGWTQLRFDAHGLALVVDAASELALWRVGEWTREVSVPRELVNSNALAMHPDGDLIAVEGNHHEVHLLRWPELTPVAALAKPTRELWDLRFSPDGRVLAMAAAENGVYLWHLDRLRRELAAMDLDWSTSSSYPSPR